MNDSSAWSPSDGSSRTEVDIPYVSTSSQHKYRTAHLLDVIRVYSINHPGELLLVE